MPDWSDRVTVASLTRLMGVAGLMAVAGYYAVTLSDLVTAARIFAEALALGGLVNGLVAVKAEQRASRAETDAKLSDVKADLVDIRNNPMFPGTPTAAPNRE